MKPLYTYEELVLNDESFIAIAKHYEDEIWADVRTRHIDALVRNTMHEVKCRKEYQTSTGRVLRSIDGGNHE